MKVIKDILTDYEINNSKSEKLKIQIGYRDIDFLIKGLNKYNLIIYKIFIIDKIYHNLFFRIKFCCFQKLRINGNLR